MLLKCSQNTFTKVVDGLITLDKISRYSRIADNVTIDYEYEIKEFNYNEWEFTGNVVVVKVINIFVIPLNQLKITNSQVNTLNEYYKFYEFRVI